MKIAFIKVSPTVPESSGIKVQALIWKKGLEDEGHIVDLIDQWNYNEWQKYDIIHIFDYNEYLVDLIRELKEFNNRIVISPIIDTNYSITAFKLASHWGFDKLRLSSRYHSLRKVKNIMKMFFVRSEYEKAFITKSYGIDEERVCIVPLSFRLTPPDSINNKEPFCLHVSLLGDKRKNVKRLILASKKYKFKLKLAGKIRSQNELEPILDLIGGDDNIEYLGFLKDDDLKNLYSRARVFALPSTYEGVGLVALEAAVYGCDIVITKLGGPKEYYSNYAYIVDPYDIDEIGIAIKKVIDGETFQPQLSQYVISNFNLSKNIQMLIDGYEKVICSAN